MYTDRLKGQYYNNYLNILSLRKNVDLQLVRLENLFTKLTSELDSEFENISLVRQELINKLHLTEIKVQYIKNMLNNYETRFQILIDERFINIVNNIESIIDDIENVYSFNIFNIDRPIDENSNNFSDSEKDMLKYNAINPLGFKWFGGKVSNKDFLNVLQTTYAHIVKIDNSDYNHITNYLGSNLIFELFIFNPDTGFTWVVYSKNGNYGSNFYIKYKSENDTDFNMMTFNDTFDKYENIETDNIFSLNMLLQLQHENVINGDTYIKIKTNVPAMSLNGAQNILLGLLHVNNTNDPDLNETNNLHNIKLKVDEQMLVDDPEIYNQSTISIDTPFIPNLLSSILLSTNSINKRKYIRDIYSIKMNQNDNGYSLNKDSIISSGNMKDNMYYHVTKQSSKNDYYPIYFKYSDLSNSIELRKSFFEKYYNSGKKFTPYIESTFGTEFNSFVNRYETIDLDYYNDIKDLPVYREYDYANYINGEKIVDISNYDTVIYDGYLGLNNPNIITSDSIEIQNKVLQPFNYNKNIIDDDYNPYDIVSTVEMKSEERERYYKSIIPPFNNPIIKDQNDYSENETPMAKILYSESYMRRANYEVKVNDAFTFFNFNMFNSRDFKIMETFKSFTLFSKKYNKFFICSPIDTTNNFVYTINYEYNKYFTPFKYIELRENVSDDESLYYGHPELSLEYQSYTRYTNYRSYNIIESDDDNVYLISSYILTGRNFNNNKAENSFIDTIIYKYVKTDTEEYFEEIFIIPSDKIPPGTVTVDPVLYNSFIHNGNLYINIYGGNNENYSISKMYCVKSIDNNPSFIYMNDLIRNNINNTYLDSVLLSVNKTSKGIFIGTTTNIIFKVNVLNNSNIIQFEEIVNIPGVKTITELNDKSFIYNNSLNLTSIYTIENDNTLVQKDVIYPEGITSNNIERSKLVSLNNNIYLMVKSDTVSITNVYNSGNRQGYTHIFIYDNKQFNYLGEIDNESMDIIDLIETSYGIVCLGYFFEIKNNFSIQLLNLDTMSISSIFENSDKNPADFKNSDHINPTFGVNESPDKILFKISCETNNQTTTQPLVTDDIPMSLTKSDTKDTELNVLTRTKFTERF